MNKLNNIFMKTDPLTNDELERYVNGDMSPDEMYQAELKMSGNPIYDDAIDGFKASSAGLAGFAALQTQFETSMGLSSAASSSAAGSSAFGQVMGVCFGIAITTVVGIGVAHDSAQDISEPSENSHQVVLTHKSEELSEDNLLAYDEVVEEKVLIEAIEIELQDVAPVAENKTITYQKALQNQPATLVDDIPEIVDLKPADPTPITPVEIDPVEAVKFDKTIEVHSNVQIIYLHELKTVDLSKLYKRSIKIRNIHALSGTPAHSEKMFDDGETTDHLKPYIYIPYQSYLNDAMAKFEANSFKNALKDYKVILSHYKDDINAHFYGALCYYNLGKPNQAIAYFDTVLDDQINSFDQEAEFYKALCLVEAGEKQKAERLFEKIENEGLFYAKRARAERMAL